jgi:nitrogen regulatory protein P-II 2
MAAIVEVMPDARAPPAPSEIFIDGACVSRTIKHSREFSFFETPPPSCVPVLRVARDRGVRGCRNSGYLMKLIIALIQPTKLEAVKEALSHVEVFRLTVMDVQGFGRQKGYTEVYRGHEFTVNLLRKIELQIAVNEDFVEPTVNAIIQAGRSGPDGKIGDGKIFILPMDDCIRIRTGERGPEAI